MQNFYAVRPGDALFSLARRFGIPFESIAAANNISSPYTIFVGQQLSIPPGTTNAGTLPFYTVRMGDTYFGLARRYNVVTNNSPRFDLIAAANNNIVLRPGVRLVIPYAPLGNFGYIAYFNEVDGGFDLFILDTRTNSPNRITTGLGDRLSRPFWGTDPTKLAFVGSGGTVYVVDVRTRQVSRIDQVELGTLISWAPDNERVSYTKGNRIIIYNTTTNKSSSISVTSPRYAQWFPSGTELLFEASDTAGISQLFRINVNGTNRRQITRNTEGLLNEVRISQDGTYALYTTPGASISLIRTVEIATGRVFEITGGPLAKNYNPTWSPDSQRITYSATVQQGSVNFSQIRAVGRQGQNDRILAISSCFATPVSWAPDSGKIAYMSKCVEEGLGTEIWSVDTTKPAPVRLLTGLKAASLAWSP